MIGTAQQMIMSSWNKEDKEEAKQDVLVKLWNVLSHKFDNDRAQGTLNFLWTVVRNKLYTVTREQNRCKPNIVLNSDLHLMGEEYIGMGYSIEDYSEPEEDDDKYIDIDDMKEEIFKELDRKILKQHKVNRTNTIYLILLKEYLIANDCNGKGFQEYICEKLGIDRKYFYQVNYKLKIRSSVFNNKK
jgi:hypothetical protein